MQIISDVLMVVEHVSGFYFSPDMNIGALTIKEGKLFTVKMIINITFTCESISRANLYILTTIRSSRQILYVSTRVGKEKMWEKSGASILVK